MPARLALAVLAAIACTVSVDAQNREDRREIPETYEEALAIHGEWTKRPSLWKRNISRWDLARTRDPRAIPVLIRDYEKAENPQNEVRYLIAQNVMDAFKDKADAALLAKWRKKNDDEADAWMWFQTTRHTAEKHLDEIRDYVMGRGDIYLKAAMLEALADRIQNVSAPEGTVELCLAIMADLPRKEHERSVLTESVCSILYSMRAKVRRDPWKEVAQALIGQFDDDKAPHRTKVVISRYLAKIFKTTNLGLSANWWRNELERKPNKAATAGATSTVPFFSIRATGYRFVYVIDASDSMLKRVTDRQKKEMGPTTGGSKKPETKEGGFVPDADDIDWSRVITRFDAAREYLRLSLNSLTDEHEFAVVLFGDKAAPLKATPKLVKATKGKIRAALAELNKIEPGPVRENRPDGVLFGGTNLHAGIAAAYRITGKGNVKDAEFVDDGSFLRGADTLFVLSDGAPGSDNFVEKDARDPGDLAGDQEAGVLTEGTPELWFQGPYAWAHYPWLLADIRRMNLFRKCEIHCVGIGEANHRMLEQLADIGMGAAVKVEGEGR